MTKISTSASRVGKGYFLFLHGLQMCRYAWDSQCVISLFALQATLCRCVDCSLKQGAMLIVYAVFLRHFFAFVLKKGGVL
ncbi:hypothetical protein CKQ53_09425 [Lonsdalea britannica]|uniref:Uncharacterized protein n=1 Tax=Lonsdalea britannica TaxID=1082704 RepID=A0AAD0SFZ3_9GAMM|nr:hypothetical protein CKQ53_09425 [Lonsdalea britannica]